VAGTEHLLEKITKQSASLTFKDSFPENPYLAIDLYSFSI
jgi:hypothetical protein